jgi:hypothetical protein
MQSKMVSLCKERAEFAGLDIGRSRKAAKQRIWKPARAGADR